MMGLGQGNPCRISLRRSALGLAALCLLSHPASAASFDCAKARTSVEKQICADADVSRQDSFIYPQTEQAGVVVATIGDEVFRIPKSYLGTPSGVDRYGFWLVLPLPKFGRKDGENRDSFGRAKPQIHGLTINVDARWPGEKALQRSYTIPKSINAPFGSSENGPFGLALERAIPKAGQPIRWTADDLYTSGFIEQPKNFVSIHCTSDLAIGSRLTGPSSRESARCKQSFLYRDFLVELGFPKTRLGEWRLFQEYAANLLDGMSHTAITSDPRSMMERTQ